MDEGELACLDQAIHHLVDAHDDRRIASVHVAHIVLDHRQDPDEGDRLLDLLRIQGKRQLAIPAIEPLERIEALGLIEDDRIEKAVHQRMVDVTDESVAALVPRQPRGHVLVIQKRKGGEAEPVLRSRFQQVLRNRAALMGDGRTVGGSRPHHAPRDIAALERGRRRGEARQDDLPLPDQGQDLQRLLVQLLTHGMRPALEQQAHHHRRGGELVHGDDHDPSASNSVEQRPLPQLDLLGRLPNAIEFIEVDPWKVDPLRRFSHVRPHPLRTPSICRGARTASRAPHPAVL